MDGSDSVPPILEFYLYYRTDTVETQLLLDVKRKILEYFLTIYLVEKKFQLSDRRETIQRSVSSVSLR